MTSGTLRECVNLNSIYLIIYYFIYIYLLFIILLFHFHFINNNNNNNSYSYCIIIYISLTTFSVLIVKIRYIHKLQILNLKIIKRWSRQILKGLLYLHSHVPPIIHRDIKVCLIVILILILIIEIIRIFYSLY